MHVILATVGTDGDVFPYVGLGAALRARGHRVTLAAPEPYRARAAALGLAFCPLVTAAEAGRMLADPDLLHPFRSGLMRARSGGPARRAGPEANRGGAPAPTPAPRAPRLVQETLGTPTASLLLQPGLLPSSTAPPEMPGGVTIPAWLPRPLRPLYWLAVDAAG